MQDKIIIFSDGASKGNPGPGGWGAVVIKLKVSKVESKEGEILELGGKEDHTTNNRMELSGAIAGLKEVVKNKEEITFYTDSKYVINGMTGWIYGWQKNNWQTKDKHDVLNKDLWEKLSELAKNKKIKWQYVGGHVGVAGNERCDEIADAMATNQKVTLYKGSLKDYKINILDLGHDEELKKNKYSKSAKAYSYLSLVDGIFNIDKTWAECEKRVKGKKNPKYQKAISPEHEKEIIENWGVHE
jgi:ribonuclease HI